MSRLSAISRVARAVSELAGPLPGRMPFSVVTELRQGEGNTVIAARDVARAIGYTVVETSLPYGSISDDAAVAHRGRTVSEDLSRASGPALIILHAGLYDGCDGHRRIVEGVSGLAREDWAINGETSLLVIANDDPATVARLVGDAVGQHDWAKRIAL